jgi:hypothetical protein
MAQGTRTYWRPGSLAQDTRTSYECLRLKAIFGTTQILETRTTLESIRMLQTKATLETILERKESFETIKNDAKSTDHVIPNFETQTTIETVRMLENKQQKVIIKPSRNAMSTLNLTSPTLNLQP